MDLAMTEISLLITRIEIIGRSHEGPCANYNIEEVTSDKSSK